MRGILTKYAGFVFACSGGAVSKMQIPVDDKKSCIILF